MTTASPPVIRKQTLRQAKAEFKARNYDPLTERQKKQIARSAELDRRAWRLKQAEKKKAETARKKAEKEAKEKESRGKVRPSNQRGIDRFGFPASQMHLGAFFGGAKAKRQGEEKVDTKNGEAELDREEFEECWVDDEALLDSLVLPAEIQSPPANLRMEQQNAECVPLAQHPSSPSGSRVKSEPHTTALEDMELLWDELASGSQINRELAVEELAKPDTKLALWSDSFCSGDFDISEEDLEELDPRPRPAKLEAEESDRALMPPPSFTLQKVEMGKDASNVHSYSLATVARRDPQPQTNIVADVPFTLAELESIVDEDLQLTQADPE